MTMENLQKNLFYSHVRLKDFSWKPFFRLYILLVIAPSDPPMESNAETLKQRYVTLTETHCLERRNLTMHVHTSH